MYDNIKSSNIFNDHLSGFQSMFTIKQKKAVLIALWTVANADGEIHIKEEIFLKETSLLLGINYNTIWDDLFNSNHTPEQYNKELENLSKSQKDWLVVTLMGVIHADGQAVIEEMVVAEVVLGILGYSHEDAMSSIKTSNFLSDFFNI